MAAAPCSMAGARRSSSAGTRRSRPPARVVPVPSATNVQVARLAAGAWMPRTNPPRAVMPLVVTCEGPTEDLCPAICRELATQLEWAVFGESAIPADAAPHGVIPATRAPHDKGAVVVALDVNQSAPAFEQGSPEPVRKRGSSTADAGKPRRITQTCRSSSADARTCAGC